MCFYFAKQLFNLLVIPFKWATEWAGMAQNKVELIYTAPQEFFFTQIKLAMFGGMVIAFPVIATQTLQIHSARPLQERTRGVFSVPDRIADCCFSPAPRSSISSSRRW